MYIILWEFEVAPGQADHFRSIYSPGGQWARLFAQAQGYLGTELLQSSEDAAKFITMDRWECPEAFASFKQHWAKEYAELDTRCEGLALSERRIGEFTHAGPR